MIHSLQKVTILLTALALPVTLASPSPEPCSDHPGVVHDPSSPYFTGGTAAKIQNPWTDSSSSSSSAAPQTDSSPSSSSSSDSSNDSPSWYQNASPPAKVETPTATDAPTVGTVTDGASQAVGQFAPYLPADLAGPLQSAIASAIKSQLASPTVVTVTATETITASAGPSVTTIPANVTVINGQTSTIANATVVTLNAAQSTATVASQTTTTMPVSPTDAASIAAINIGKAIENAFAAVNASQAGLNNETVSSLETCLNAVLKAGGMPDGYSCLTQSGSTGSGLSSTLRTTLEQFVGILPNSLITNMFDAIDPLLATLLPASEYQLIQQIQDSIASVIATSSGSSVTALEQVQDCYTSAIQQKGNTSALECYAKTAGSTLATASNSMLESFVGVLPASLMTSVQNILAYNLGNSSATSDATLAAKVQAQISNALNSAASTLSGNTVSLAETLQACTSQLILTGNATAAQDCITQGPAAQISQTMVSGIAEQFQGYLPSSFFTDLVTESNKLINTPANVKSLSPAQINAALDSYFNNATSYGPAFVTCFEQVQQCLTNAITKTGTIDAICPGPVGNCQAQTTARLTVRYAKRAVNANTIEKRAIERRRVERMQVRHVKRDLIEQERRAFAQADELKNNVFDPSRFAEFAGASDAVRTHVKRGYAERLDKMHNLQRLRRTE